MDTREKPGPALHRPPANQRLGTVVSNGTEGHEEACSE